jgi:lysophospholipase L1-like esterase
MKRRVLMSVAVGIALLSACSSGANDGATGSGGASGGPRGGAGGSSGSGGAGQGSGTGGNGSGGQSGGGTSGAGGAGGGTTSGSGGNGSGGSMQPADGGADSGSGTDHWVGTWTGAPQLTESANLPPASLSNSTLRQVVHVSLGGSQIRLRFSNEFGNGPVTINQAHVAVCRASPVDSTIDTATDKALAFSGMASVTIAQGMAVWSDPLDFNLAPLGNLTATVAFGSTPNNLTGHPGSRTTSYQQTGSSNVSAATMSSAQQTDHWYILSGVDVMADQAARGLVVLGDSITDGRGSTTNGNDRWPDDLAKRLLANAATANVAVMNQGIGGNGLFGGLGPNAPDRYSRDVLGQSGVRWVIVFEGVNDLGGGASASSITAVFDGLISQAHAQNLLIYGATITPFGGNVYYTPEHESARQAVNTYIKSGKFDGYVDLDAAIRDSSNPPKLQAAYDSGDGLHLNPTGYQKMADTVDLILFSR